MILGQGTYSDVYKVQRKADQKLYAMKRVKMANMTKNEQQNALNEVQVLSKVNSQFVISFKEAFIQDNVLYVVMEFASKGDVSMIVERHRKYDKPIEETKIWNIMIHSLKALNTLHRMGIIHRDVKPANLLVSENNVIKLADLNVSKQSQNGLLYTQTGTPFYAAPEIWQEVPYDSKIDVWGLGCCIYELCALKPPFQSNDMAALYKSIMKGQYAPLSNYYSADLRNLITSMLHVKPKHRPSSDDLLNMTVVRDWSFIHDVSNKPPSVKQEKIEAISLKDNLIDIELPEAKYYQFNQRKVSQLQQSLEKKMHSQLKIKNKSTERAPSIQKKPSQFKHILHKQSQLRDRSIDNSVLGRGKRKREDTIIIADERSNDSTEKQSLSILPPVIQSQLTNRDKNRSLSPKQLRRRNDRGLNLKSQKHIADIYQQCTPDRRTKRESGGSGGGSLERPLRHQTIGEEKPLQSIVRKVNDKLQRMPHLSYEASSRNNSIIIHQTETPKKSSMYGDQTPYISNNTLFRNNPLNNHKSVENIRYPQSVSNAQEPPLFSQQPTIVPIKINPPKKRIDKIIFD